MYVFIYLFHNVFNLLSFIGYSLYIQSVIYLIFVNHI